MGDLVSLHAREARLGPRGCDPAPQRIEHAGLRTDLLMVVAAARAVLDARSRREQSLAIARLGAAVAAHDRGWVA